MMETLNSLFMLLGQALEQSLPIMLLASLLWGVCSVVLSPCHVSSIPLVVGYVSRNGGQSSRTTLSVALYFSAGVAVAMLLLGLITAWLGKMLGDLGTTGSVLIGVVFVLTGLWLLDLLRAPACNINLAGGSGRFGGILLGFIFGAALGPCTFGFMFPVLAVSFRLAESSMSQSVSLIAAYAIGHSLVIVVAALAVNKLQAFLNWDAQSRGTLLIKRLCGVATILTGAYLIISRFAIL